MRPEFSILIVCLNPGGKLETTLKSVAEQTYKNYEIIIKDGLSTDGTPESARKAAGAFPSLYVIEKADSGIYDAMNQAAACAKGKYVYFLNCGDVFYDERVLENVHGLIVKNPAENGVYYGNIYERQTKSVVVSNPKIDAFGCYRNVPCHQACFYDRRLVTAHPFDIKYRVRADYEQFLWCFFTKDIPNGVRFVYGDILIARYEGGGFSAEKENRKLSAAEHKEITGRYMTRGQIVRYRLLLWLTLSPLRTYLSENPATSGAYNGLKKIYYGKG